MKKLSADELFKIAYQHFLKKDYSKSKELFEKLINVYPDNLSILRNLSQVYAFLGEFKNAEVCVKKIISIKKDEPFAYQFLATILKNQDKIDEMINIIDEALKDSLINKKWIIQKKLLFPVVVKDKNEIKEYRKRIEIGLNEIISSDEKLDFDNDQVVAPPNFELSYNEFDNLELNKKIFIAFKKIYKELNNNYENHDLKNKKIKIGFVSEFFTDHTIGKLFKNLIFSLDTKKFEIIIYHSHKTKPGKIFDEFKKQEVQRVLTNIILPKKLSDKLDFLKKEKLNILFYPDIGMSTEFYFLSMTRIAKHQIMSWGHPETTGFDTIDYFLASKKLINENSKKLYSEKFLLMENLPMIYDLPKINKKLSDKDISKKNIYSCPQTIFKFHPDFDLILFDILKKDKKGILYLIKDTNKVYYLKLIERFKKNKDYDPSRVIFLDPLNLENFINHLGTTSVLLDPLYFGSGNSFHESMFYGTPTVTLPTKYIKSKIVSAAYNQMEIEEPPIVETKDQYVNTAIKIANNENILELKKSFQKKAREKLFNTKSSGVEFNSLLSSLVNY